MKNPALIILILTLSVLVSCVEFYLNSRGEFLTETTQTTWGLVFGLLTIWWAWNDAKERGMHKPFDFGFLMYVFWPVAFPYYLLSSRKVEGIIWLAGFAALWSAPFFAGLVAYIYVYE